APVERAARGSAAAPAPVAAAGSLAIAAGLVLCAPVPCATRPTTSGAQRAPGNAAASRHRVADNGSYGRESRLAARPREDNGCRNTVADRPVTARERGRSGGSTGPIRSDAAPTRGPNARPIVAAHRQPSRGST